MNTGPELRQPSPEPEQSSPRSLLGEWLVVILILLFGTTTLVQAFVIPTGSMEDTLLIGDHLLVDKLAYAPAGPISKYLLPYTPVKHGDIVVFRYPVNVKESFVKRVIGLPGDRIRIENKVVVRNGRALTEPYKFHKTAYVQGYRDFFPSTPNVALADSGLRMLEQNVVQGEVVVPDSTYFVMGDNRDASLDSRYWGFVPRNFIIGKPLLIYWSYETTTDRLSGPALNQEHLWDLARNFFVRTRWRRTFRLIRGSGEDDSLQ